MNIIVDDSSNKNHQGRRSELSNFYMQKSPRKYRLGEIIGGEATAVAFEGTPILGKRRHPTWQPVIKGKMLLFRYNLGYIPVYQEKT